MFRFQSHIREYLPKLKLHAPLFSNDLSLNCFALITNALGAKLRW